MQEIARLLADPTVTPLQPLLADERELLTTWAALDAQELSNCVASRCGDLDGPVGDALLDIGLALAREGDAERGGALLRTRVMARLRAHGLGCPSFRQCPSFREHLRAISRRDRVDGLQRLILDIVAQEPAISAAQLLVALRKHEYGPVIDRIEDGLIEWRDASNTAGETRIEALASRLTRARKRIARAR